MKKALTYFVITATLLALFVPVASLKAQTCDPEALQQVRYGQRGAAVRNLQACLMDAGYSIPAGATGYYGNQTRNAVREFYKDQLGMSWHGNWIGPKGVEALKNALVAQAPAEEKPAEGAAAPTISADVLAQVLQKIQAGDVQGALALLLQALGAQVPSATPTQPTATPTAAEQPGEAVVEVRLSATPAGGVVVKEDQSANVLGIRVISRNAYSDVQRVRFDLTSDTVPTRVFKSFELYDGENKLASVSAGDYVRVATNKYQYTFSGFSVRVSANSEKVLTIRVVVNPTVDSSDITNKTFTLTVGDGYVRAVDGVGVQHTPSVSGTVARSFTVEKALPTGVALVIYKDLASPYSNNYAADSNRNVKDLEVVRFVVRADNDTLKLQTVTTSLSVTSATVTAAKLVDANNNVLDSVANPGNSFAFQGVDFNTPLVTIGKDQKVTLKVLVDLTVNENLATNTPATVQASVTNALAERSDGGSTDWPGSVQGDVQNIYRVVAANWKVTSATANTSKPEGQATTTLLATFVVEVTAQGGDVYIPSNGFVATTTGAAYIDMGTPSITPGSGVETVSGYGYVVRKGNTGTLTVNFAQTPSSWPGSGYIAVILKSMTWDNDTDPNFQATTNFPGTVETKTRTPDVYLTP